MRRALALTSVATALLCGPAMALINPSFTPIRPAQQSRGIPGLTVAATWGANPRHMA
jgi:hypothetical protein